MKATFTGYYDLMGERIFEGDMLVNTDEQMSYRVTRVDNNISVSFPDGSTLDMPKFILTDENNNLLFINQEDCTDHYYNVDNNKHDSDNAKLNLLSEIVDESEHPSYDEEDFFNKLEELQGFINIALQHKGDEDYVTIYKAKIDSVYRLLFGS